eukprot:CAMPEP_0181135660 /NCGR_PEP_ID=MMETSP1071-20121207/32773_1 /TAXON_ID=35127 /ORGANISM="Thalassiosira sp., Strain NH16" /LENGTH=119 /DNA_ID=CAMNT_0023222327 /DNA_START=298 /DNA_END=657 /DNA_ORIENTATION=+
MDVDEYFYDAILAASSFWSVKSSDQHDQGGDTSDSRENDDKDDEIMVCTPEQLAQLERRLQFREEQLETCLQDVVRMMQYNEKMEARVAYLEGNMSMPQTPRLDSVSQDPNSYLFGHIF